MTAAKEEEHLNPAPSEPALEEKELLTTTPALSYQALTCYILLWALMSASESGYGVMVFSTSNSATNSIIKSLIVVTGKSLNVAKLNNTMNKINIVCSLANTIITPISLLNIRKHIEGAQNNWQKAREECLNNRKEKIIFYSNLAAFVSASVTAALPISASLFDLMGYKVTVSTLAIGGFLGQLILFWLIGSSFIFEVPEKMKNLPNTYPDVLRNIFSCQAKSLGFLLRTLVATTTRFIKMGGMAAYTLRYLLPIFYSKLVVPYGLFTSVVHTHDGIFTQVTLDYDVTFSQRGSAAEQTILPRMGRHIANFLKVIFFFFLAATFVGKLLSATGLITGLIVGNQDEYSLTDALCCLAVLFFQAFGAQQQVAFVKNGFTDPVANTIAKKVCRLGVFNRLQGIPLSNKLDQETETAIRGTSTALKEIHLVRADDLTPNS